jgi:hypothetical protein
MTFEVAFCDVKCQGKTYARQCRNSRAWRLARLREHSGLERCDFECPYGLALNNLPIGDNAPEGTRGPEAGAVKAFTCRWGLPKNCCHVTCFFYGTPPLLVVRGHCWPDKCRFYEDGDGAHNTDKT